MQLAVQPLATVYCGNPVRLACQLNHPGCLLAVVNAIIVAIKWLASASRLAAGWLASSAWLCGGLEKESLMACGQWLSVNVAGGNVAVLCSQPVSMAIQNRLKSSHLLSVWRIMSAINLISHISSSSAGYQCNQLMAQWRKYWRGGLQPQWRKCNNG